MSKKKVRKKIASTSRNTFRMRSSLLSGLAIAGFVIIVFIAWFVAGTEKDLNRVTVPHNVKAQIAALDEDDKIPLGSFQINMNNQWTFPTAKSTSADAYVSNYIGNTHSTYFTITLPNSEEVFYTSPLIPIGGTLKNITLDCDLPAGKHEAVLEYHLMESDGTEYSTLSVSIEINILK